MATMVLPEVIRALYPFKSQYCMLSDGKRMHYIDEGPEDGEVLVFAHGYPMWSFEYRALIVYYAALGYRCVAVDHIGYGLSDKPTSRRYHTLRRHVYNLIECITALDLKNITLVMEDWGGPLALGYAIRYPQNIKRLVMMNTWGVTDSYLGRVHPLMRMVIQPGVGELLLGTLNLAIMVGIQSGSTQRLSPIILGAYKAPFRDRRSRAALIRFPRMLSLHPSHPSAPMVHEIQQELGALGHIPTLILRGSENTRFAPNMSEWKHFIPRAKGPIVIENANHFLPEDAPETLIEHLDAFFACTG
jgi:haloalkane dehalogenase